jgi:hypothetical protein
VPTPPKKGMTSADRRAASNSLTEQVRGLAAHVALSDERRFSQGVSWARARETLFLREFEEIAVRVFRNPIRPSGYAVRRSKPHADRVLNLLISDTHFHSLLDAREVGHSYGPMEEARRLSSVTLQTSEYKTRHRDRTTLYLHYAGDIIQGQLHDPRDGAPMAAQMAAAIHLLAQQVAFFSKHFPKVWVRVTPGNHGRNTSRHKDRATNQKWDALEQVVYYAVKKATASLPNVRFDIGYQPFYTFKAFDRYGFITHGDTVLNPGYPGRTIDVATVRKQINEINGNPNAHEKYSLFAVGHVHVGSLVNLPNDSVFVSNGCLIPPDAYAKSIGIFNTACGQYLWESVERHIVGDSRFLNVGFDTDKDTTLDAIIRPFTDF